MVSFKEITPNNHMKCLNLEVDESQKSFVAPNSVSLAQAWVHYSTTKPFAIYNDDDMVGFIMFNIDNEKKEGYLWRFMIDKAHQGKGFGKQGMEMAVSYLKSCNMEIGKLSVEPENIRAKKLYESFGFIETGEIEENELVMKISF